MSTQLLNMAPNERLSLGDVQHLGQTQPLGMQADVLGTFATTATADAKQYILHGFATTAGVGGSNSSPAANQLQVSPGSGILAYRAGAGTPLYGVMASLDGSGQAAQSTDLTYSPSGAYKVHLRLNYADGAQTDRSFWNAASPGSEYAASVPSRKVATWEIQALAASANPGPEWLAIAAFQWTSPSTQGGAGTISNLQDIRPLYFEGIGASANVSVWGSNPTDRSSDRGTYGIGDLRTFVDAMRTCLEDIKGPGLARWWSPGVAGINVGFTPNSPTQSRVALGDASFYLQGRSSATNGHAYFVSSKDGNGNLTGWDFASDRTRFLQAGSPVVTYSNVGSVGFGAFAETDLFASPGRSVVEIVTGGLGQFALRIGARAGNGQVPVGIDALMKVVAPDQTGNLAQILFARGGVQGTEQTLFQIGKGGDNTFHMYDAVNSSLFFSYNQNTRLTIIPYGVIFGAPFADPATGTTISPVAGTSTCYVMSARDNLVSYGGLVVKQLSDLNNIIVKGTATFQGSTSFSGVIDAPAYRLSGQDVIKPGNLQIPTGNEAPSNPQPGAMFYRTGQTVASKRARVYIYIPQYNTGAGDDGLPDGWKALSV